MNWNKNGRNVRKAINEMLSKIFGITEPRLDKQAEKPLLEAEIKKNQAIDLIRRSSNIYPCNPMVSSSLPFDSLLYMI